jgi:hypothetical protein
MMLAERVSRTAMVPAAFRNKPDEVLAVVLYGAELGIGPMQALQQINFIAGKPSAAAELLRALVMEAGRQFILSGDDSIATAQCKRKDWTDWRETTFTIFDAQRAGLGQGDGWRKYPDQMLAARVTSKACRMWFPDVISGMSYTSEEVESFTPSSPATRTRQVTHSVTNDETGELASDEKMDELTAALGRLDESDQATVKAKWIDAGLPPLQRGLTTRQASDAHKLVNDALNAPKAGDNDTPLATATQVRAINTLLTKVHVAGPARHDVVREIIERRVDSLNDLTKDEATTVIDRLKANEQQSSSRGESPDSE